MIMLRRTSAEPEPVSTPLTPAVRREVGIKLPQGPLVTTDWLSRHLDHPQVRVLDVRGRILPQRARGPRHLAMHEDFREAHIPGARFVDWTRCLLPASLSRPDAVSPDDALRARLAHEGVSPEHVVVLYDDTFNLFASRGAWALRALGFHDVRVLDGGWNLWRADLREVSSALPPAAPVDLTTAVNPQHRGACADDVARALGRGLVIDARLPSAYEGRVADGPRPGHIPGAVNIPYNRVCSGDYGRFASPAEIRRTLSQAGVEVARIPDEVVVYCATGAMAAAVWVALETVGVRHARIYEPGVAGWSADATRPVVVGALP